MRKMSSRERTAQEFIHVEAIENRILWTTDKLLFAFVRVRGQDNSLLDESDHAGVTEKLAADLSGQAEPYQIISIPRTVDVKGMLAELAALRETVENPARRRLLDGETDALEELAESGAKEPLIFIKLWKRAARGADRELLDRAEVLAGKLRDNKIAAEVMEDPQILHLCALYAELGVWQDEEDQPDIPMLPGRPRLFSRKPSPEEIAHTELMERIAPAGLFFQPTGLMIGSSHCRCYGAARFPGQIDYGWAVSLMNATDCVTCITYDPARASEIGNALSQSIRDAQRDAQGERDARKRKRLERSAQGADILLDQSDGENKTLGQMSVLCMPFADSPEGLEKVCGEVRRRFSGKRITLKALPYLQEGAFRQLSPYYPPERAVEEALQRIVPLETLAGGYPMTVGILRDDHGIHFARTLDRKMLVLDIRYKDKDRTNGNGIVTGVSGTGKSTMLKHLLESMLMLGMKAIVIDPEREFRDLCKALGGSWWDAGGGKAKVNILQIQAPIPDEEDEEEFTSEISPLAEHLQYLKTMLRYKIPSLTDPQMELLERALRELYARFGITLDTEWKAELALRQPTEYPIMKELWQYLLDKSREEPEYAELALLVESMAIGADSIIWNGYTSIDLGRDLVVIDTNRLYNNTDQNQAVQYYNLMHMGFSAISADRDTPYLFIADEAQILFDPKLEQAAKSMKNMATRVRKYEGYLWLAFHSLQELLDERVRLYGQSVLDSAAYKILFGTDGQNLEDTVRLFHLTPAEEKVLSARQRKRALAMLGAQRMKVEFDIPAYKLELMGKGGGR